jgi:hypothetical protein
VLFLLLVVVLGGLFAFQALKARAALIDAQTQAELLQGAMTRGDEKTATTALASLQVSTADAHANTDGPLWGVAAGVPWAGKNVDAVRTVSRVLDSIVRTGLNPVVEVAGDVSGGAFRPKNGQLDLEAIERIAPGLERADQVLTVGRRELRGVEPDDLIGPLSSPMANLQRSLAKAQSAAAAGSRAATLMPQMLGGDGTRRYLLVFQNNAEIRATGGMPGAFAVLKAKQGRISIDRQGSAGDLRTFKKPVIELEEDERNLYSNVLASLWSATTFTPDFPRTAQIMQAMFDKRFDERTDGVISVDPVALSYILEATGPIKLADGAPLDADNAVELLLNTVYLKFAPEVQDVYFADAAQRVFQAVVGGQADPLAVIQQLARSSRENRLLISSSHADEQEILESTRIAGKLSTQKTATPHLGLYLNDSTGAKLQYYLKRSTTVKSVQCRDDDSQVLSTTTKLSSTAPRKVTSFPPSVVGVDTGEKPGSMRMNLRFYAPLGGEVTKLAIDGVDQTINRGSHLGRDVAVVSVLLAPGQSVTVTTRVDTGRHQPRDAVFSTTPGIESTPNNVRVTSACR